MRLHKLFQVGIIEVVTGWMAPMVAHHCGQRLLRCIAQRHPVKRMLFVMTESWTELKDRLIRERGKFCERCGEEAMDLHHGIEGRMKKKPELNVEENGELLCRDCHANPGGYDERVQFWNRQCERYGYDHMRTWHDGLNLKVKEMFE